MIALDDAYLLMIEPKSAATEPVDDELTALARDVFAKANPTSVRYRGFHVCVCGEHSDNREWVLPNGVITNSLLVHYIQCHRGEVPESELKKLRRLAEIRLD